MKAASQYDVAIAGAGPAGSSLAIRLAQRGLKVLLVEQKRFPRAKLCGEFISPECLTHFAELGVADTIERSRGIPVERTVFYSRSGSALEVPSRWFNSNSHAMGLSRAAMDKVLLDRAAQAGAEIMLETQASGLILDTKKVGGIRVKSDAGEVAVRARLTVDATGRVGALARQISPVRSRRADFLAFKTHLENAAIADGDCEIYSYRGGYGGCTKVENGVYNLCFIVPSSAAMSFASDAGLLMKKVVMSNKRAAVALRSGRIVDDWLAVPITRYGRSELVPVEGLLTVGDAAAFIDPFTGSGILMALECARIAADAIANRCPWPDLVGRYKRDHEAAFNRRLRLSSTIRLVALAEYLPEVLINTLRLAPPLTRALARQMR